MEIIFSFNFHFNVKRDASAITLVFLYSCVFLPDDGRLVRLKKFVRQQQNQETGNVVVFVCLDWK
jgi:hypothetical protein